MKGVYSILVFEQMEYQITKRFWVEKGSETWKNIKSKGWMA
jgi:hypothetical protein